MKTFKMPLLAVAFFVSISAVFAFSFPAEKAVAVKAVPVSYHYKISATDLASMKDISNWEVADPACDEEGSLPCVIRYEGNISQFNTYLQTFTTANAVTLRADEKKD
ncbi:MAG: hypothetical protein H7Y86_04265 [Rhizobacter sp.]|nr:hypothetical protein [Ferruginibacter sp.]